MKPYEMMALASFYAVIAIAVSQPKVARAPQAPKCNPVLWEHVYHPYRLQVIKKCVSVVGTIMDATGGVWKDGVRHELDGDTHGWLRLDPGQYQDLDAGNRSDENGNLVYEVICHFPVHQVDAFAACDSWKDPVTLQPVGAHVRITGVLVKDLNHGQWMEIHPVTSIVRIPQ